MTQNTNISIFSFLQFCTKKTHLRFLCFCVLCHIYCTNLDLAPQKDRLKLSFENDNHTVGKKMARKGSKMAIYQLLFF